MALKKDIELENGIVVNYHRIVSVNSITNQSTIIEVGSYINESQREKEKSYQELQIKNSLGEITSEEKQELNKGINIVINTKYYNIEYDKNINVDNAYDHLKKMNEYSNAEDI